MGFNRVAIGCDHGGFALKGIVCKTLKKRGIKVLDFGTNNAVSVDYPYYGYSVAKAIIEEDADSGILICGTGIGISIAANRYPQVRAAVVCDAESAKLCRQHNNANVLCLGGRTTSPSAAKLCLEIFLDTEFDADGRHERRVKMLSKPNF